MDDKSGKFTCQKCKSKKMDIYTNWLSRKKYITSNNLIKTYWIFYYKTLLNKKEFKRKFYTKSCFGKPFFIFDKFYKKKCFPFGFCKGSVVACFFVWPIFLIVAIFALLIDLQLFICMLIAKVPMYFSIEHFKAWKKCLNCDKDTRKGVLLFLLFIVSLPIIILYVIIFALLYILIFLWIEVCGFLCCKKNEYKYIYSYISNNNIIQGKLKATNKNDIWYHCEGITEDDLIQKGNYLFTCPQCNYNAKTFKNFIYNLPKEDINNNGNGNNENDTTTTPDPPPGPDLNIAIIFSAGDQTIHYCVACKLTDSFQIIENKLIKEYPELKNKKLFYLAKGQKIDDKHKTLAQLKLNNADIISFYEHHN